MSKKQINLLVIDDDQTEKRLFEIYTLDINDLDVNCSFANSFEASIPKLIDPVPDIVFLDNRIGRMENYTQTMPELRAAGYEGPVIVMSASLYDEVFERFRDFGVCQCIDKLDISAATLQELLKHYVP